MTNVIILGVVIVGLCAYYDHTQHNHEVVPVTEVAPTHSPELLEFIDECERDNLIVTWISEVTVSCTRR